MVVMVVMVVRIIGYCLPVIKYHAFTSYSSPLYGPLSSAIQPIAGHYQKEPL
jgi:hypothetical protein